MTKIIATMALAGLLLATLACRTAEVVERPPTVTPRPSFDSFNYPTNVPTPTRDYEAISRLISEARGTFVPATLRPATRVRPTPDGLEEDCEIMVDTVAIMRRTGASDQEVMDALLSSGMVSSEGARALAARCEVDLGTRWTARRRWRPIRRPRPGSVRTSKGAWLWPGGRGSPTRSSTTT